MKTFRLIQSIHEFSNRREMQMKREETILIFKAGVLSLVTVVAAIAMAKWLGYGMSSKGQIFFGVVVTYGYVILLKYLAERRNGKSDN